MRHTARCQCCGARYTFGVVYQPRCLLCELCEDVCTPGVPSYVEQIDAWELSWCQTPGERNGYGEAS